MQPRIALPIVTARLEIRPLRRGDAAALHRLYGDPIAMEHLSTDHPRTVEDSLAWVQDKIDLHEATGLSMWAITRREDGEVIGDGGLQLLEDGETVEVGVRLIRAHWRQGFGGEAAAAIIAAGFRDLQVRRIVGITAPGNTSAVGVMQAIGMRPRGAEVHYGREWIVYEARRS